MRIRSLLSLLLVVVAGSQLAPPASASVVISDQQANFSFRPAPGWQSLRKPGTEACYVPGRPDGRVFMIVIEPARLSPLPVEDETQAGSYIRAFWSRFDSAFEEKSHTHITHRGFEKIGDVPFRVLDAERQNNSGTTSYLHVLLTSADGKIYSMLAARPGSSPVADADLGQMIHSFTFVQPPGANWVQASLPYFDDVVGLPIFLGTLVAAFYLFATRHHPQADSKKRNLCAVWCVILLLLNFWLFAGTSVVGVLSMVLFAFFILMTNRYSRQNLKDVQEGQLSGASPRVLKFRFWLLLGSFLMGLAVADVQLRPVFTDRPWMFYAVNLPTLAMIILVLWWAQRRFKAKFPPAP